jgi:hypothetical protein
MPKPLRASTTTTQNTVITFEEAPVSAQAMEARPTEVQNASLPWLVAELDVTVVGYAYATKWKVRSACCYSVETAIYLEHGCKAKGSESGSILHLRLSMRGHSPALGLYEAALVVELVGLLLQLGAQDRRSESGA